VTGTNDQTLPLKSFFPAVSHFFTRLGPTYRRHTNVLDGFLKDKLAASRAKAKTLGMSPALQGFEVPPLSHGWWREPSSEEEKKRELTDQELIMLLI
jgi:hypothetical protein